MHAPGRVGLEDHLGVAVGEEAVAERAQLHAQVAEVVDAAVEHDAQAELAVDHRLLGVLGQVEDLEALVSDRDAAAAEYPAAVRPARVEHAVHACYGVDRRWRVVEADLTAYATHLGTA